MERCGIANNSFLANGSAGRSLAETCADSNPVATNGSIGSLTEPGAEGESGGAPDDKSKKMSGRGKKKRIKDAIEPIKRMPPRRAASNVVRPPLARVLNRLGSFHAAGVGVWVVVRISEIAGGGWGLFTMRWVNAGQILTYMEGFQLDRDEVFALPAGERTHIITLVPWHVYLDGRGITPEECDGGLMFANEARGCTPNCKVVRRDDKRGNPSMVLQALVDMEEGTECLISYDHFFGTREQANKEGGSRGTSTSSARRCHASAAPSGVDARAVAAVAMGARCCGAATTASRHSEDSTVLCIPTCTSPSSTEGADCSAFNTIDTRTSSIGTTPEKGTSGRCRVEEDTVPLEASADASADWRCSALQPPSQIAAWALGVRSPSLGTLQCELSTTVHQASLLHATAVSVAESELAHCAAAGNPTSGLAANTLFSFTPHAGGVAPIPAHASVGHRSHKSFPAANVVRDAATSLAADTTLPIDDVSDATAAFSSMRIGARMKAVPTGDTTAEAGVGLHQATLPSKTVRGARAQTSAVDLYASDSESSDADLPSQPPHAHSQISQTATNATSARSARSQTYSTLHASASATSRTHGTSTVTSDRFAPSTRRGTSTDSSDTHDGTDNSSGNSSSDGDDNNSNASSRRVGSPPEGNLQHWSADSAPQTPSSKPTLPLRTVPHLSTSRTIRGSPTSRVNAASLLGSPQLHAQAVPHGRRGTSGGGSFRQHLAPSASVRVGSIASATPSNRLSSTASPSPLASISDSDLGWESELPSCQLHQEQEETCSEDCAISWTVSAVTSALVALTITSLASGMSNSNNACPLASTGTSATLPMSTTAESSDDSSAGSGASDTECCLASSTFLPTVSLDTAAEVDLANADSHSVSSLAESESESPSAFDVDDDGEYEGEDDDEEEYSEGSDTSFSPACKRRPGTAAHTPVRTRKGIAVENGTVSVTLDEDQVDAIAAPITATTRQMAAAVAVTAPLSAPKPGSCRSSTTTASLPLHGSGCSTGTETVGNCAVTAPVPGTGACVGVSVSGSDQRSAGITREALSQPSPTACFASLTPPRHTNQHDVKSVILSTASPSTASRSGGVARTRGVGGGGGVAEKKGKPNTVSVCCPTGVKSIVSPNAWSVQLLSQTAGSDTSIISGTDSSGTYGVSHASSAATRAATATSPSATLSSACATASTSEKDMVPSSLSFASELMNGDEAAIATLEQVLSTVNELSATSTPCQTPVAATAPASLHPSGEKRDIANSDIADSVAESESATPSSNLHSDYAYQVGEACIASSGGQATTAVYSTVETGQVTAVDECSTPVLGPNMLTGAGQPKLVLTGGAAALEHAIGESHNGRSGFVSSNAPTATKEKESHIPTSTTFPAATWPQTPGTPVAIVTVGAPCCVTATAVNRQAASAKLRLAHKFAVSKAASAGAGAAPKIPRILCGSCKQYKPFATCKPCSFKSKGQACHRYVCVECNHPELPPHPALCKLHERGVTRTDACISGTGSGKPAASPAGSTTASTTATSSPSAAPTNVSTIASTGDIAEGDMVSSTLGFSSELGDKASIATLKPKLGPTSEASNTSTRRKTPVAAPAPASLHPAEEKHKFANSDIAGSVAESESETPSSDLHSDAYEDREACNESSAGSNSPAGKRQADNSVYCTIETGQVTAVDECSTPMLGQKNLACAEQPKQVSSGAAALEHARANGAPSNGPLLLVASASTAVNKNTAPAPLSIIPATIRPLAQITAAANTNAGVPSGARVAPVAAIRIGVPSTGSVSVAKKPAAVAKPGSNPAPKVSASKAASARAGEAPKVPRILCGSCKEYKPFATCKPCSFKSKGQTCHSYVCVECNHPELPPHPALCKLHERGVANTGSRGSGPAPSDSVTSSASAGARRFTCIGVGDAGVVVGATHARHTVGGICSLTASRGVSIPPLGPTPPTAASHRPCVLALASVQFHTLQSTDKRGIAPTAQATERGWIKARASTAPMPQPGGGIAALASTSGPPSVAVSHAGIASSPTSANCGGIAVGAGASTSSTAPRARV